MKERKRENGGEKKGGSGGGVKNEGRGKRYVFS